MKQEYEVGTRVKFKVWTTHYVDGQTTYCDEELTGTIIGYNPNGFLTPVGKYGIKRYKVQLNDTSIMFLGANRLKPIKEIK